VLFCLTRQPRLNAQQISVVTGRPKTSIASAVKQLQKKKLITRVTDTADSRRQVLHLTEAGREMYRGILSHFVEREKAMLAGLTAAEREQLMRLFDKLIRNAGDWAKPY
jgi:DNA-binding MarR family transcriptional regulator